MKKILIFLFISTLISCHNYKEVSTRLYNEAWAKKPYDVIIVPGMPFEPNKGWNYVVKTRILWSKYLIEKGIANHVMYSGAAVYTPYKEGEIMAFFAEKLGIPKDKILMELNAEHSVENVYFSYLLAKEKGYSKIAVATEPYQSLRFKKFKSQTNLQFDVIPMIIDSFDLSVNQPEIDASKFLVNGFVPLPDRKSGYLRFYDSGGKHLPKEIYKK